MADAKGNAVGDEEAASAKPAEPAVSLLQVLRTADAYDILLMTVGTICGAACGAVQPWCGDGALCCTLVGAWDSPPPCGAPSARACPA